MLQVNDHITMFILGSTSIIFFFVGLSISLFYRHQQRKAQHQQQLDHAFSTYEKNMLTARLEMQEETFNHVSREIHDNINLSLTLAKLHLNTIDWNDTALSRARHEQVTALISDSIDKLSSLSRSLNADLIQQQGLLSALQKEVQRLQQLKLFTLDFSVIGTPVFLDTQKELIIFRIFQEAFNNILKHAAPSQVFLQLQYTCEQLRVLIRDNGRGFITTAGKNASSGKEGSGLLNMRTRVNMLQGQLQLLSAPQQGTAISFTVPLL